MANGFVDGTKNYIIEIINLGIRDMGDEYEIYNTGGKNQKLPDASLQKWTQNIQEERLYPIFRQSKKANRSDWNIHRLHRHKHKVLQHNQKARRSRQHNKTDPRFTTRSTDYNKRSKC